MKPFIRSKKWTAAMVGIVAVGLVYSSAMVALVLCESGKAQHVISLANMAVVFLGAITGSLVTGQSFVDWRHGSNMTQASEDRREKMEQVSRVYAPKFFDDAARGGLIL